jgi:hypothetical protein
VSHYGRGSVFRKRGIWWIQYYRHGRRHMESSQSRVREEAERLLSLRLQPPRAEHYACPNCGTALTRLLKTA